MFKSSVSSLIKKNVLQRVNKDSEVHYSLTEEGEVLAKRLKQHNKQQIPLSDKTNIVASSSMAISSTVPNKGNFHFCYVDNTCHRVESSDQAEFKTVNGNSTIVLLLASLVLSSHCFFRELCIKGKRYLRIFSAQDPDLWTSEYNLLSSPTKKRRKNKQNGTVKIYHSAWIPDADDNGVPFHSSTTTRHCIQNKEIVDVALERRISRQIESSTEEIERANYNSKGNPSKPTVRERREKVWRRHEFEIVLLLDTREVGKGKDRNFIHEQLVKKGVNCEVRNLALGDIMWVAQIKNDENQGFLEYVLDIIVERKKLDDLWASIKDGRYHEQKVFFFFFSLCYFVGSLLILFYAHNNNNYQLFNI